MVTRVYKCTNEECEVKGVEVPIKQRITEDILKECMNCKEDTLVTVIQPANFNLSGGGWTGSNIAGGGR